MIHEENNTTETAGSTDKTLDMGKTITNASDPASPPIVKCADAHEAIIPSPEDYLMVEPLEINLGQDLIPLADPLCGGDLLNRINRLRNEVAAEIGILLPKIRVRDSHQIGKTHYRLGIDARKLTIPVSTSLLRIGRRSRQKPKMFDCLFWRS